MQMFARERGKELSGLLQLPNGAPSADTFERVFRRLDVESLRESLISKWRIAALQSTVNNSFTRNFNKRADYLRII
jgi:hypothetical protein